MVLSNLKYYSQILCGGSAENVSLVILYWFGGKLIKKQRNPEAELQLAWNLFIWTEVTIVWLIIGSDNIFNIEVNGALAMYTLLCTTR